MTNPYDVLGVSPTASDEEIRKAFRRKAKTSHPDLHPGDAGAEGRFKETSLANEILSDPDKRKRFDAGEIDASGEERPRQNFYKDYSGERQHQRNPYEDMSGFADFNGGDGGFADLFGRGFRQQRRTRGHDLNFHLTLDFLEAVNGGKKAISLPDGGSLSLTIPPGIETGKVLRLRGKGEAATGAGESGDALVEITVSPHPFFTRKGRDIHMTLPVTLTEAVLGGRIEVPTPAGNVMLVIKRGSNSGSVMRLKGKGVATASGQGDELITLQVVLPGTSEPALEAFFEGWEPGPDYNPRKDMKR